MSLDDDFSSTEELEEWKTPPSKMNKRCSTHRTQEESDAVLVHHAMTLSLAARTNVE